MTEPKYTEGMIVDIMCQSCFRVDAEIIIPNCMITGREADILRISPQNYAHEIEVKCTRADLISEFAPDRMKTKKELSWSKHWKHRILSGEGKQHIISRYSVAVPPNLRELAIEILPAHYGLYVVTSVPLEWRRCNGIVDEVRRAKRIVNSRALNDHEILLMCRITCSRYWHQRLYGANGRK